MKKNSRIRAKKLHAKKFTAIAAYSREFTVKNTKKGISEVIKHKRYGADAGIPDDKLITSPYTGIQYVMTNPHPIHGEKYDVTVTGYDWVPIDEYKASIGLLWEHKKYPQPKNLRKKYKKKYYFKGTHEVMSILKHGSDYAEFKNFPYTLPKMNKVQYMEKLVEHKLAKWEHKNVCPEAMFTEDVENWKIERENAMQRIRDFVVSVYHKLPLTGRYKESDHKFKEELVAELKDKTGEGHKVNELKPGKSKLLNKAQEITNQVHAKNANLVCTNLRDHKHQRGRILLPKAA